MGLSFGKKRGHQRFFSPMADQRTIRMGPKTHKTDICADKGRKAWGEKKTTLPM